MCVYIVSWSVVGREMKRQKKEERTKKKEKHTLDDPTSPPLNMFTLGTQPEKIALLQRLARTIQDQHAGLPSLRRIFFFFSSFLPYDVPILPLFFRGPSLQLGFGEYLDVGRPVEGGEFGEGGW